MIHHYICLHHGDKYDQICEKGSNYINIKATTKTSVEVLNNRIHHNSISVNYVKVPFNLLYFCDLSVRHLHFEVVQ